MDREKDLLVSRYCLWEEASCQAFEDVIQAYWDKVLPMEEALQRKGERYVFYEGPPSANGKPGLHHMLARTIKDLVCRYKTQQGYVVARRAGWDTHGLPIELQVEKALGIRKDDIGKSISITAYNQACREAVMQYTSAWETFSQKMGVWMDYQQPYRTYDRNYIETLWWLLSTLYDRDALYEDYAVQPYSPAAGTSLSQHELHQPGCYKEIKDWSITAQFKVHGEEQVYLLAWTTTPWTLPANSAIVVHKRLPYVLVEAENKYTKQVVHVWCAEGCIARYFDSPPRVLRRAMGEELIGLRYVPLFDYFTLPAPAFQVHAADFVTTDEGSGLVHISMFGADDFQLCKEQGIPMVFARDAADKAVPIVNTQGCYVAAITDFADQPVRVFHEGQEDVNEALCKHLIQRNGAFEVHKHTHSYPHCWRTDRPIIYYPTRHWFVRTSQHRDRLVALNDTISWFPSATGRGRFKNWLEGVSDWNISRTRFWGTPLPVWVSEDRQVRKCIGSFAELQAGVEAAIAAGVKQPVLEAGFDPHRPGVDEVLLMEAGKVLYREPFVIDVWFDSGAMPYAQWHYPFENTEQFEANFPADFIAEGVDQTRGWFFTLHVLGSMLLDKVAYKNVVSHGLVLDKDGRKMSKRLGNSLDPMALISTYGADMLRWYLITNSNPWENVKFDVSELHATTHSFRNTLKNVFNFYMSYAKLDGFVYTPSSCVPLDQRHRLDRWILSRLHGLIALTTERYDTFQAKEVGRAIQHFIVDDVSNWYIRLNRRRFWLPKEAANAQQSKQAAYETLHECLWGAAQLMAPIVPFMSEFIYGALQKIAGSTPAEVSSVHVAPFPKAQSAYRDEPLEISMQLARKICSLVHAVRKRHQIKVRQPLARLLVPTHDDQTAQYIAQTQAWVLQEVNVKQLDICATIDHLTQCKLLPNSRVLGPKVGKKLAAIKTALASLTQTQIQEAIAQKRYTVQLEGEALVLEETEWLLQYEDMAGWEVARDDNMLVAVDITLTPALMAEGQARELVRLVQEVRKSMGLAISDKIAVCWFFPEAVHTALQPHAAYIAQEIQATTTTYATQQIAEAKDQLPQQYQAAQPKWDGLAPLDALIEQGLLAIQEQGFYFSLNKGKADPLIGVCVTKQSTPPTSSS